MSPLRRNVAMGAGEQPAARASSCGVSGSAAAANTRRISRCLSDGSASSRPTRASSAPRGSRVKSVAIRVPACPRTPAGRTVSSTWPQGQR